MPFETNIRKKRRTYGGLMFLYLMASIPSCATRFSGDLQSGPSEKEAHPHFQKATPDPQAFRDKETLNILVFGDSGTAKPDQDSVAQAMYENCYPKRLSKSKETSSRLENCDLAFVLGDIIYETGAKDTEDPLFETAFKNIYDRFFPMVFWVVLGNHDWGNPTENGTPFGVGKIEQKGRRPDIYPSFARKGVADGGSQVWTQPGLNYTFSYELASTSLDVVAVDTQTLLVKPAQRSWLRKTLDGFLSSEKTSDKEHWRILIGHVPLYSSSRHQNMDDKLRSTLLDPNAREPGQGQPDHLNLCGKVHVYLAGHDHNQQFLESKECPDGEKLYQVVSGAAAKTEHKDEALMAQSETSVSNLLHGRSHDLGFTKLKVSAEKLVIEYHTIPTEGPSRASRLDQVCTIERSGEASCRAAADLPQ